MHETENNTPLLEKWIGFEAFDANSKAGCVTFGGIVESSFPNGKFCLFRDRIVISIPSTTLKYDILLKDIECIKEEWADLSVIHHCEDIPDSIKIRGFFLYRAIKKTIRRYNLELVLT